MTDMDKLLLGVYRKVHQKFMRQFNFVFPHCLLHKLLFWKLLEGSKAQITFSSEECVPQLLAAEIFLFLFWAFKELSGERSKNTLFSTVNYFYLFWIDWIDQNNPSVFSVFLHFFYDNFQINHNFWKTIFNI